MFQKLVQLFLQKFVKNMGRGPGTPAEWMEIQDQAVRHLNKTKGAPPIKKDPFQGWDPKIVGKEEEKIGIEKLLEGPVRSKGPKGDRIWDFSQKKGEVIDFPNKGIRGLMEKGDLTRGTAPKTLPETLQRKKESGILLRDADEDIARIKSENKSAIQRFKKKMDKDPDKFQQGGIAPLVGEPSYAADFYDDRTPYLKGKIVKGIKTLLKKKKTVPEVSGIDDVLKSDFEAMTKPKVKKDRLATADELEDYIETLDPTGEAGIVNEGMTVKELDKMVVEQKAYERHMYDQYKTGKLDPVAGEKTEARRKFLQQKLDEAELSGDNRLITRDEMDELESFNLSLEDIKISPEDQLRQKYPGIADELVEKILIDNNPQRKADVTTTIDQYMKLKELGKSEAEAYDIITKSFDKKIPTKHAEGGRIGYSGGGQTGFPAVTHGLPQGPAMKQPQMPAGPQPTGIPGGTIVAPNNTQQNPLMGQNPNMNQGIGGMPRPGAQPRAQLAGGGMGRRAFLKMMAAITGTGVAAGTGILKLGKAAKVAPKVAETIATTGSGTGMPVWFPKFVEKALKHGEDVTDTVATTERVIVKKMQLPKSKTDVYVETDLVTGDTSIDIGMGKHGWSDGWNGQPTRMQLRKGEEITEGKMKGQKTADEFEIEEAEFSGGHPENVKFEESSFNKYGDHGSDFSELEEFATGKVTKGSKAQKEVWEADSSMWDDVDDFAKGGLAHMLGE